MGIYYLDSSALLKRYVNEIGTPWVQSLFDPALGNHLAVATVSGAEIVSAISRRMRGGGLSKADASQVIQRFENEFRTIFDLVDINLAVVQLAMDLAEHYGLRGYDALQLAAVSELNLGSRSRGLGNIPIVSSDLELNAAAVAEGIPVENPMSHP